MAPSARQELLISAINPNRLAFKSSSIRQIEYTIPENDIVIVMLCAFSLPSEVVHSFSFRFWVCGVRK